jgi:sugar (pentulose or hexulose) kinase
LHLPQYISFLFTGKYFSDITSIGCHTNLWDFELNNYHEWLEKEGIIEKLAPINADAFAQTNQLIIGTGLHDSSAALIPYLATFKGQKFVLISTGTWCITLNPFNHTPLTDEELQQDCLMYMQYTGEPVKASRLFAGYEHEQINKALSEQYQKPLDYYKNVKFDAKLLEFFNDDTYESAYHQLILNLVNKQIISSKLVLNDDSVKMLFVDGGFGKNEIYMNLLAKAFPVMEVYAASVAQATALGAALGIHHDWNKKEIPQNLIELKSF